MNPTIIPLPTPNHTFDHCEDAQRATVSDQTNPVPTILSLWDQCVENMRDTMLNAGFDDWLDNSIDEVIRKSINDLDSELAANYEFTLEGLGLEWDNHFRAVFESFVSVSRDSLLESFRRNTMEALSYEFNSTAH